MTKIIGKYLEIPEMPTVRSPRTYSAESASKSFLNQKYVENVEMPFIVKTAF